MAYNVRDIFKLKDNPSTKYHMEKIATILFTVC